MFLRKLDKQGYIRYKVGTDEFTTSELDSDLVDMDEKTKKRLEKIQDLVLFRYGTTGVQDCLQRVVELLKLVPVYPVRNVNNLIGLDGNVLSDVYWTRPGTTVKQFSKKLGSDFYENYYYAETIGNIRLGEDDEFTLETNIVAYKTRERCA